MHAVSHAQAHKYMYLCVYIRSFEGFLPSFGKRPLVCGVRMLWGFHFPNPFNVSVFYLLHSGLGKSLLQNIRGFISQWGW